ncbi:hypothetical protein KR093_010874, partial [Drosophila rubida]
VQYNSIHILFNHISDNFELQTNEEFRCDLNCGKVFKSRHLYELHQQQIHGIVVESTNFKCPATSCSYFAKRLSLLGRHYLGAHIEKNFTCFKCHRNINESMLGKHNCDVQHNCPICSKVLQNASMRNNHVQKCVKRARALEYIVGLKSRNGKNCILLLHTYINIYIYMYIAEPGADHFLNLTKTLSDEIFIEEFQQLLRNIDNKSLDDPDLIGVLTELTKELQEMQI